MFIKALLTTAKIRNQPRCPSTNEWIKEIIHTHTHTHTHTKKYCSAIKKNEIMSFKGKMDGTGDPHQTQNTNTACFFHTWNLDLAYKGHEYKRRTLAGTRAGGERGKERVMGENRLKVHCMHT
jgi:hypothetical protein